MITKKTIDSALNYEEYFSKLEKLYEEGKTSGPEQSEELIAYSKLNFSRMKRLSKTIELGQELKDALENCSEPMIWLVLTEAWCGDAAQSIPLLGKIAKENSCIDLKLIFRDENLDIMDQFLTNGGRSIPKLIALRNSDLKVLGTWGPRPKAAQDLVNQLKEQNLEKEEWITQIQMWYTKDKTTHQQKEIVEALKAWHEESNKK